MVVICCVLNAEVSVLLVVCISANNSGGRLKGVLSPAEYQALVTRLGVMAASNSKGPIVPLPGCQAMKFTVSLEWRVVLRSCSRK